MNGFQCVGSVFCRMYAKAPLLQKNSKRCKQEWVIIDQKNCWHS